MPHPILVQAVGEPARALRELIEGELPDGFETVDDVEPTKGLKVEPVSVALIAAGSAVLSALISSLAVVWAAHIQKHQEQPDKQARAAQIPTVTISTHSDEIVVRLGTEPAAAVAAAELPNDPMEVVEIRLGVE